LDLFTPRSDPLHGLPILPSLGAATSKVSRRANSEADGANSEADGAGHRAHSRHDVRPCHAITLIAGDFSTLRMHVSTSQLCQYHLAAYDSYCVQIAINSRYKSGVHRLGHDFMGSVQSLAAALLRLLQRDPPAAYPEL